jgi:hypothetical protein
VKDVETISVGQRYGDDSQGKKMFPSRLRDCDYFFLTTAMDIDFWKRGETEMMGVWDFFYTE